MTLNVARPRSSSPPILIPLLVIVPALGVLAALAYGVSVYVAAVPYAVGFMGLVYLRPDLAFGLMLASAPFCYDLGLGPAHIALSDISMVLALPVLLIRATNPFGRFLRNPVLPAVGAYFVVCIFSIVANGDFTDALTSMVQMGLYLIVAVFVFSSCIDDRRVILSGLYGLLVSCAMLAVLKLCTNSLYILGLHKNSVGSSLSYGVIVAAELWISSTGRRRRILSGVLVLLLAGLVSSLSRGAWIGALAGIMLILLLRKQFTLLARITALAVPTLVVFWLLLPAQAKEYATDLNADSYNVKARLKSIDFAYSYFASHPVLGAGVGLRKEYDATNLVMSTLAETGVAGLATFLLIYVVFGWMIWRARSAIVVTSPLFSLLALGSALVLCQFLHGMVDHFWSRGCLPPWAGLGTASFVYYAVQARSDGGRQLVRR
jgi:hypothetical protein